MTRRGGVCAVALIVAVITFAVVLFLSRRFQEPFLGRWVCGDTQLALASDHTAQFQDQQLRWELINGDTLVFYNQSEEAFRLKWQIADTGDHLYTENRLGEKYTYTRIH